MQKDKNTNISHPDAVKMIAIINMLRDQERLKEEEHFVREMGIGESITGRSIVVDVVSDSPKASILERFEIDHYGEKTTSVGEVPLELAEWFYKVLKYEFSDVELRK